MEQQIKTGPKDVFLNLLVIITLYVSVISFIALLSQYISYLYPDPSNFYFNNISNQIRLSSAALIVVFPVFIFLSWLIGKDLAANPSKRELKSRRWLIYLTLFISAVTIIVDLVTMIYNFYSGDLTIQFFLKILVIFLVAGAVFGYYAWELKRSFSPAKLPKVSAWTSSVIIFVAVVAGFFIVGSPATQRDRRFDEQRANNLQILQNEIVNYWTQKDILPSNLDALKNSISGFNPLVDPQTGQPYEYNIKSKLSFELCANFKKPSLNSGLNAKERLPVQIYSDPYSDNWNHGVGRSCFERTIDPQLYKNRGNLPPPKQ